jgi:hypothetical protein
MNEQIEFYQARKAQLIRQIALYKDKAKKRGDGHFVDMVKIKSIELRRINNYLASVKC